MPAQPDATALARPGGGAGRWTAPEDLCDPFTIISPLPLPLLLLLPAPTHPSCGTRA